jgi:type IV pilus assembly protein PilN
MIKINLLRSRKERKKEGMRKEMVILIPSVVFLLALLILVQWRMGREKDNIIAEISKTQKEIAYYKSLITEVNKAKETQKIIQDKLNVINSLRKEKSGPAKVLDELSINKPEKIQLESLKKEGSKLGIEGIALDDETVAHFMENLRNSKFFKNVDLIVTEQVEQSKFKFKKFILSCEIVM